MPFLSTLTLLAGSAAPPAQALPSTPDLDERVSAARDADLLHGAIAVVRGGDVLHGSANGVADGADRANSTDTPFPIASLTKLVTQVAVARLVESGRLDLDRPLGEYVPELPEWLAHEVTPRHLLTMTSGLPRELSPDPARSGVELDEDGSVLAFLAELEVEPEFAPGTGEAYSNVGYWLLGGVVEGATGRPFERVVEQLVLEPLALADTGLARSATPGLARGLTSGPEGPVAVERIDYARRYSSGGYYSTVADLARLCSALADPEWLGPTGRTLVLGADGRLLIGGMLPGFMNALVYDAERDVVVVALNNHPASDPNRFIQLVQELATVAGEER